MVTCIKIRRRKRTVCIGDMQDEITIQDRDIIPPEFGKTDFDENFSNDLTVWSAIKTVTGKTFFDGVNTDTPITHEIYIFFDATVTAESWIIFEDRRIDILKVEDFEERHEFMLLTCIDRGLLTREASKA